MLTGHCFLDSVASLRTLLPSAPSYRTYQNPIVREDAHQHPQPLPALPSARREGMRRVHRSKIKCVVSDLPASVRLTPYLLAKLASKLLGKCKEPESIEN